MKEARNQSNIACLLKQIDAASLPAERACFSSAKAHLERQMIPQELFQHLEQMAHACGMPHNSWEGYGIVLRFVTDVLAGVPTLEALESCSDIDLLFGTTLQRLAQLVADLFPTDPFEELATFLPRARRDEARRAASHREEGK